MNEQDMLYTLSCITILKLTIRISRNLVLCLVVSVVLIGTPVFQSSFAHQRALYNINGKNYLMEVETTNEPVSVDDKTSVELTVVAPNMTTPMDPDANGTQPITGLENSLKVDIQAGNKTLTSDLDPAFGELGVYDSQTYYPTVPTTYSFKVYGDINGTQFSDTFACNPVLGEDAPPDNSTVKISNGVERTALTGGLDCPDNRVGFPEPYVSNFDLAKTLNETKQ